MPAVSNSFAAFSTSCSSTIGVESHENFVTFECKGKVGMTKTSNLSLPFLPYFEEKIKSGGPYSFIISLPFFLHSKQDNSIISSLLLSSLFLSSLFLFNQTECKSRDIKIAMNRHDHLSYANEDVIK